MNMQNRVRVNCREDTLPFLPSSCHITYTIHILLTLTN